MRQAAKAAARGFLYSIILPTLFVGGTIVFFYYQWPLVLSAYDAQPVLTGNALALWFLVGLAFAPIALRFYQFACVGIILAATAFNVVVGQIELTETVLVFGIAGIAVSLVLVLGRLGTNWWKFCQGKFAGDVNDVDT